MRGGGPFQLKPGEWTDDTSMALALGEALIQDPLMSDPALVMNRWLNWYRYGVYSHNGECFDIGGQTRNALSIWEIDGSLPDADTESAGNGCIMRLAPAVAVHFRNKAILLDVARRQSDFTHRNPECRRITVQLAGLLSSALLGDVAQLEAQIPGEIASRTEAAVKSTGYVVDTFEAAVWAFAPKDGFDRIVLRAVNLGDDADTVGAVAGQIAGAYYGLSQIPRPWLEVLAWRDDIIALGRKLHALSMP